MRHYWEASIRNRRDFLLSALLPIGGILISVVIPFYIAKIFAGISTGRQDPGQYYVPLAVAAIAGIIANRYGFAKLMDFQAKTMRDLQADSVAMLLRRGVGFHTNRISGKLVSDAIDYPNAFGQLTNALFINLIPFAAVMIGGITVVLLNSLIMGLALSAVVAVTIGWALLESRRRAAIRIRRLQATKAVTAHMSDSIINASTVKTFAREDDEIERHNKLGRNLEKLRLRDWRRAAINGNNRIASLLVMQLAFIALIVHLVTQDRSLLGAGIFSFAYTITLTNRLFELTNMTRQLEDGFLSASPMVEMMQEETEIKDAPDAQDLKVQQGAIRFKNVSFHYPDTHKDQTVFEQLTIAIQPGEKVGLVGPSGGGKSTLTRLLLRFEDIQAGQITIDGQSIQEVTQRSLHQAIGYVPQEPLLFHRSIRENIAYGNPVASEELVREAAHKAYALDFIEQLPQGFETVVGERGVKLSGGQRQRIAIARAILKDAPILLLDEATSALDSESEIVIQKALDELMQNRTSIVIAHRLSTIQKMDRILVLDSGSVIEQGTHKQLISAGGLYATLWKHQSGGFIEE